MCDHRIPLDGQKEKVICKQELNSVLNRAQLFLYKEIWLALLRQKRPDFFSRMSAQLELSE